MILLAAVVAAVALAPPVWAQGGQGTSKWEIEGFGGGLFLTGSTAEGTATLPPPGPAIATSSPVFPSRRVPSWFFGDGALLLNQVNQQFSVTDRIVPLDGALGGAALNTGNGFAAGVRVRRVLTGNLWLEGAVEFYPGAVGRSDELLAAVDATRDSFAPAFEGLLSTGPFQNIAVAATSSSGGSSLEMAATAAVQYRFGDAGSLAPYITLGGGLVTGLGDGPAVTLEGRYAFDIVGEVPIDETDRITIRQETSTTIVGLVGGGLRRQMTERWGFSIDGRLLLGPGATSVVIDAAPSIATGTPADFVESFTTPSIQFSNDPSTGRESSLGPPGLDGFESFDSDRLNARIVISAGIFWIF
ncbi:MAG: hypothetical protein R3190_15850 [Thermoanaerobaculia bacterium]|nr:hypothetical protein [Thermoanaerobaculia bacterium]